MSKCNLCDKVVHAKGLCNNHYQIQRYKDKPYYIKKGAYDGINRKNDMAMIKQWLEQGESYQKIGKKLGVSRQRVHQLKKKFLTDEYNIGTLGTLKQGGIENE
jgi:hypothetical protein